MPGPKRQTKRAGVKASGSKRRAGVKRASSRTRATSLTLPVIDPTESAREALRLMSEYGRSGVLSDAGGWRLYDAAHVVITLAEDPAAPLSAVPARSVKATPSTDGTVAVLATTRGPSVARRRGRRGVSPAGPGSIDRAQAQMLSASPRDCYCRVDHKPVAGGRSGGDCPSGHRGSVRCV